MKTNKNSMVFGLKILSILAFSLFFMPFNNALAAPTYVSGHYNADGSYTYGDFVWNNATSINNPAPTVNSINPKSSNIGVGTKTITISGNGFVPSSVARVNASNRPTTFIDGSHLLVQITGNDTSTYRTNGGFFITVFNGAPGGGYSNAAFFTINNTAIPSTISANINNGDNSPDTFTDTNGTVDDPSNSSSNLAATAVFGAPNSFLPSGLIQWILFAIIILLIVVFVRRIFGAKKNYEESPMKHA